VAGGGASLTIAKGIRSALYKLIIVKFVVGWTMLGREETETEKNRADLIKRLFAIAISVGFATSLAGMDWVRNAAWPKVDEIRQLCVLGIALAVTVLSWDGYLLSIKNKPLGNSYRFAIDVILVFVYMFLLLTAEHANTWILTVAFIFFLYFVWDILTIKDFKNQYDLRARTEGKKTLSTMAIYWYGITDNPRVTKGPVITICWFIYFALLSYLYMKFGPGRVISGCFFALCGLRSYRRDKRFQWAEGIRGYGFWRRTVTITCLLAFAGMYFKYGNVFPVIRSSLNLIGLKI
jgi:hypothetical protein